MSKSKTKCQTIKHLKSIAVRKIKKRIAKTNTNFYKLNFVNVNVSMQCIK